MCKPSKCRYWPTATRSGLADVGVCGDEARRGAAAAVSLPGRLPSTVDTRRQITTPTWRGSEELQTWQNSHPRSYCCECCSVRSSFIHLFIYSLYYDIRQIADEITIDFLPARRYASAGYSDRNVSVCLSVRLCVRHAPVLWQNKESYRHDFFTIW